MDFGIVHPNASSRRPTSSTSCGLSTSGPFVVSVSVDIAILRCLSDFDVDIAGRGVAAQLNP